MKAQISIQTNRDEQVAQNWFQSIANVCSKMYSTTETRILKFNKKMEVYGAAAAYAIRK